MHTVPSKGELLLPCRTASLPTAVELGMRPPAEYGGIHKHKNNYASHAYLTHEPSCSSIVLQQYPANTDQLQQSAPDSCVVPMQARQLNSPESADVSALAGAAGLVAPWRSTAAEMSWHNRLFVNAEAACTKRNRKMTIHKDACEIPDLSRDNYRHTWHSQR